MKRFTLTISVIALLGLGIFVGFKDDDIFFAIKKNYTIFGKIYEELSTNYVDEIDPSKLMRSGIDEMMKDLDPYTVYFDEAANEDAMINARGGFGTVGAGVGMRGGKITIIELLEGFSAQEQGVHIGDHLIEINGISTNTYSVQDVANLLDGEPGSKLSLTIQRDGEKKPLDFELIRKVNLIKSITYYGFVNNDSTKGIGYIKLARFGSGCAGEVKRAIEDLQKGDKLKGLVFDLRGNLGGLLDQAIGITSFFVPKGSKIVSTRGRLATSERAFGSNIEPIYATLPLTILVDNQSASASEIVSGAVQDLDRGLIIGETTFGKGLVQTIRPLPYGTSMKYTTAKYYTPSGRSIQAINYSARDENGNPLPVPDSLRQEFKTKNGRIVKDGHGIDPDVPSSFGEISELEQALLRKSLFFLYANHYAAKNKEIAQNFAVTDNILADFESWVSNQKFTYQTRSEETLERLQAQLEVSGYEGAKRQLASLTQQIEREKREDFKRHASRLKQQLLKEIIARYFGPNEATKLLLSSDNQVDKAIELIEDSKTYNRILGN